MRSNSPSWFSFFLWLGIGGRACSNFLAPTVRQVKSGHKQGFGGPGYILLGSDSTYQPGIT